MTRDLLDDVAGVVEAVTGRDAARVRPEQTFVDDLGVDSLAMLEVLERLRLRLGVAIDDEATAQLVHVGDLLDYLATHRRR